MKCISCRTRHAESGKNICWKCQRKVDKVVENLNLTHLQQIEAELGKKDIIIVKGN